MFLSLLIPMALAATIQTNEMTIHDSPEWVKRVEVEKLTEKIQNKLEWRTRKVPVYWHSTLESFSKAHSLGPLPAAVTIKSKKKTEIHMSPTVDKSDYKEILGHELVHVIFYQKYKASIPRWLEEGFANFYSRTSKVDYKRLARQKLPEDVTQMQHPYKQKLIDARLHYHISQALAEMLDEKCDLDNLLRLSVQKKLENYIIRTCGIKNINQSFQKWLLEKSQVKD